MPPKAMTSSSSSSSYLASTYFKPGSAVEVNSDDDGFRGSWFTATVIRRCAGNRFLVEYQTLMADERGSKPLREVVNLHELRPLPPSETDRVFKFGEEVDAFHNDGWWEGFITRDFGNGRFAVFFRVSKEQIEFSKEDLRLHREWLNGNWDPPFEQQEMLTPNVKSTETVTEEKFSIGALVEEMLTPNVKAEEKFSIGQLVEVSSDEDGFQGAWFSATIVQAVGKEKFLVEYQNLLTDDDSELLKEEVDILLIRPYPPETHVIDRFNLLEEVDAQYNDGWWVGVISKVLGSSTYIVYFRSSNEEMEFQHSQLRLHQDWIDGKWVMASKALKF